MRLCIHAAWQYRVQFGEGTGARGGGGVEERERKPGPVNNLKKKAFFLRFQIIIFQKGNRLSVI